MITFFGGNPPNESHLDIRDGQDIKEQNAGFCVMGFAGRKGTICWFQLNMEHHGTIGLEWDC